MSYLQSIKPKLGPELFARLEKEANNEVSIALQMPLKNHYGDKQYYSQRFLMQEWLPECHLFDEMGLNILPMDIIDVLFRGKLLFACKTEEDYYPRAGRWGPGMWRHKASGIDALIEQLFELLADSDSFQERTLLTQVNSFHSIIDTEKLVSKDPQSFFDGIFKQLGFPFVAFLDEESWLPKHKEMEPGHVEYTERSAQQYFYGPSIGFTASGSEWYCYWHAATWLRTFFNLLRIAGFIHPGQIDFGNNNVAFLGPKGSVFLGTMAEGCFSWMEETREPWQKSPDGSLFLSFGHRGLSKMWLDKRTFRGIEGVLLQSKPIFEHLVHPWSSRNLRDVIPTLEILNSATQLPDLGAKTLMIYCCLEHLFVPNNMSSDSKKHIIGGLNAIRSDLLPWFNDLYKLRCQYAHKGFIVAGNETRGLIKESLKNVLALLLAKLRNS